MPIAFLSVLNPQIARPATQANFLVVLDPAHGGNDPGARISPNLLEKDITLSLARRLRQQLQTRNVAVELLRDGDRDISLDQRVVAANFARASLFITLHSQPGGATLRVYTPVLPVPLQAPLDRSSFLPWQQAQGAFAKDSSVFATSTVEFLQKRSIPTQLQPAFLQPLHSIAAPAIAIEAPADQHGLKISEEQIAGALADAIALRKQNAGAAR